MCFFPSQNFKAESTKLQDLLQKHGSDIKQKSDIISKLNSEAENQMKEIKHLSEELTKNKEMNDKSLLNSSEIHKDFMAKIADLEAKYSQVLEEKKKVFLFLVSLSTILSMLLKQTACN